MQRYGQPIRGFSEERLEEDMIELIQRFPEFRELGKEFLFSQRETTRLSWLGIPWVIFAL